MNVFAIKLIALILMTVDHIGLFLFPENLILRAFGRLSFPLFAWLIANGIIHTKNAKKYLLRLGTFAVLSQLIYNYTVAELTSPGLSIFTTLFLGAISINVINNFENKLFKSLTLFATCLLATLFNSEYGAAGVLSILFFHLYFNNLLRMILSQFTIYFAFFTLPQLHNLHIAVSPINLVALIQFISVLSILFINQYNGKLGPKFQYAFYLYYPFHLIVLYLISSR